MESDTTYMRQALKQAVQGLGAVEPNPMVGAVIVRDGKVIAEGHHERFGGHHAEVNALGVAGEAARGSTMYVTLEPCCHVGKTPACTEALLRAGVARVVVAMQDPFEHVSGRGLDALRRAGISVEVGVLESDAQDMNRAYLKRVLTGVPYIHVKWAMSLDGKIATRDGNSQWISSTQSREIVHELRGRMDAIIVGAGTVRADDPLLTARPEGRRVATRIVFSSDANIGDETQLVRTARDSPVVIACHGTRANRRADQLEALGCEVMRLTSDNRAVQVQELIEELGRREMTNVLVEGGSELLGSFSDARLIDELHVFVAPRIIGGEHALTPVGGIGASQVSEGLDLELKESRVAGGDWYGRFVTSRS